MTGGLPARLVRDPNTRPLLPSEFPADATLTTRDYVAYVTQDPTWLEASAGDAAKKSVQLQNLIASQRQDQVVALVDYEEARKADERYLARAVDAVMPKWLDTALFHAGDVSLQGIREGAKGVTFGASEVAFGLAEQADKRAMAKKDQAVADLLAQGVGGDMAEFIPPERLTGQSQVALEAQSGAARLTGGAARIVGELVGFGKLARIGSRMGLDAGLRVAAEGAKKAAGRAGGRVAGRVGREVGEALTPDHKTLLMLARGIEGGLTEGLITEGELVGALVAGNNEDAQAIADKMGERFIWGVAGGVAAGGLERAVRAGAPELRAAGRLIPGVRRFAQEPPSIPEARPTPPVEGAELLERPSQVQVELPSESERFFRPEAPGQRAQVPPLVPTPSRVGKRAKLPEQPAEPRPDVLKGEMDPRRGFTGAELPPGPREGTLQRIPPKKGEPPKPTTAEKFLAGELEPPGATRGGTARPRRDLPPGAAQGPPRRVLPEFPEEPGARLRQIVDEAEAERLGLEQPPAPRPGVEGDELSKQLGVSRKLVERPIQTQALEAADEAGESILPRHPTYADLDKESRLAWESAQKKSGAAIPKEAGPQPPKLTLDPADNPNFIVDPVALGRSPKLSERPAKILVPKQEHSFPAGKVEPLEGRPAHLGQEDVSGHAVGIVSPEAQKGMKVMTNLKRWLGKEFSNRRGLREEVFQRDIQRVGAINSGAVKSEAALRRFQAAVRPIYGRKGPNPEQLKAINDARITGDYTNLHADVAEAAKEMFGHLDHLSDMMVAAGMADDTLKAVIRNNRGVYLHRSYRRFQEPNFKPHQDHVDAFLGWLRKENPQASDDQIIGLYNAFMSNPRVKNPWEALGETTLGKKYLDIFQKKHTLPKELRQVWGEVEDPLENFMVSFTKMHESLENHRFISEVREMGLQDGWLIDSKKSLPSSSTFVKVDAKEFADTTFAPLGDLYMDADMADAMIKYGKVQQHSNFVRAFQRANLHSKEMATVFSFMTHARNFLGNLFISAANGHFSPWHLAKTMRTITKWSDPEAIARYTRLQELGVVGDGGRAGELKALLKDLGIQSSGRLKKGILSKVKRYAVDYPRKVYQAEDDFWKMNGFFQEVNRYRKAWKKAGKVFTEAELEEHAAKIIRDTYPTYSMTPEIVKRLRHQPVIAPFATFPAEILRTGKNQIKFLAKELKDPTTRHIGYQRIAGLLAAVGPLYGFQKYFMHRSGVSSEEDAAIRAMGPYWQRNGFRMYMGRNQDTGQPRYWDMSYTTPHQYLIDPIMAFVRTRDEREAVGRLEDAVGQLAAPFVGPSIFTDAMVESFLGEKVELGNLVPIPSVKKRGGKIARAVEEDQLEAWKRTWHLAKEALIPGTAKRAGKSWARNQMGRFIVNEITGFKTNEVDPKRSLFYAGRDFRTGTGYAEGGLGVFTDAKRQFSLGKISKEQFDREKQRALDIHRRMWDELAVQIDAAYRLGVSTREVKEELRKAGVTNETRQLMAIGKYKGPNWRDLNSQ